MSVIFPGSAGLNTKIDPFRLQPTESGQRWLTKAINAVVEKDGRVSLGPGYLQVGSAGNYRSIFSSGEITLVIKDDVLSLVNSDYSTTPLRTVSPGQEASYIQTDIKDRIYWSTEMENGYIEDGVNYDWALDAATAAGPAFEGKHIDAPPCGHLLEYAHGSIFVAVENAVYYSVPFYPGLFQFRNYRFHYGTKIRLLAAVNDGLWIGDEKGIYWITFANPGILGQQKKISCIALPGQAARIDADQVVYQNLIGVGQIIKAWTEEGLCILGPGGFFLNETIDRLDTEKEPRPFVASRVAGEVWRDKFIAVFDI